MHDEKFTKGMRGEFRGDFTRDTFDPLRHFSRVLMQQGRVQLDADKNESDSIHLYHLRTLGKDLMGPHAAPSTDDGVPGKGFKIIPTGTTFMIAAGHYYVNGILCENDIEDLTYFNQPDLPFTAEEEVSLAEGDYLVYLDVWERHLSTVEDDYIREKALGSADTATRAQIVWQVKVLSCSRLEELGAELSIDTITNIKNNYESFLKILTIAEVMKPGTGRLRARARKTPDDSKDPCLTSPEASYRGAENQLYRVEVHNSSAVDGVFTFKYSRENGSVIFPITNISGNTITLEHLGRDTCLGLKPNDWVEIVDDDYTLRNRADALMQIEGIDPENLQVTLKNTPESLVGTDEVKHPYLRRWDQTGEKLENGVPVSEGPDWILLEDGVEIQFPEPDLETGDGSNNHMYHTGDYWLIPARTATDDVEWPGTLDSPDALSPQGVEHHYAPLAIITVAAGTAAKVKTKTGAKTKAAVAVKADSENETETDLRRILTRIWE
jgi:hypothetical protein